MRNDSDQPPRFVEEGCADDGFPDPDPGPAGPRRRRRLSQRFHSAVGTIINLLTVQRPSSLDSQIPTRAAGSGEVRPIGASSVGPDREQASFVKPLSERPRDRTADWRHRTFEPDKSAELVLCGGLHWQIDDVGAGWRLNAPKGSQRVGGGVFEDGLT